MAKIAGNGMTSFLTELRRRKVFRVAAVYAVVAWLLVQIIVAVEKPLGLPDWSDTLIIVVAMIGFPLALVLAWAFQIAPDGVTRIQSGMSKPHADDGPSTAEGGSATSAEPSLSATFPAASIVVGKPTLAVLAFDNLSGDPQQEYFCDGIAEDIITDLSKISGLAVVGRQSSFAYKGRQTDLRRIGRELGVRYVLEGSIRKSGEHVRVSAQLIEAQAGTHLWANRYDYDAGDAFRMGDEIAEYIVTALDVKLAHGEDAKVWRKAVKSPAAREAFFRGQQAYYQPSPANTRLAREYFIEAMRLEPDSAQAHASAASTHAQEVMFGWSRDVRASLAQAERLALRALELDAANAGGHYVKGIVALFNGLHGEALEEGRQALSIRPMCSGPRAGLAYMELYSGKPGPAIKHAQEAITLNPVFPGWYLYVTAAAEFFGGQAEKALATLDRVLQASPDLVLAKVLRVAALQSLGRSDAARAASQAILSGEPELSSERLASTQPFQDPSSRDRYVALLREAGLLVS